jgi:hypothetical protein
MFDRAMAVPRAFRQVTRTPSAGLSTQSVDNFVYKLRIASLKLHPIVIFPKTPKNASAFYYYISMTYYALPTLRGIPQSGLDNFCQFAFFVDFSLATAPCHANGMAREGRWEAL